jgi:hypothetical protein
MAHELWQPIVASLSTSDALSCAQVSTSLRALGEACVHADAIHESSTPVTGDALLWMAAVRLGGRCQRISLVDCENITKAQIAAAVAACPALVELTALRVGPGSWSARHLARLFDSAPPGLRRVAIDLRLEMKKDLHEGSPALSALANPALHLEKLTLISDNVTSARAPENIAPADMEAAGAALAAANADDAAGDAAEVSAAGELVEAMGRLCAALTRAGAGGDGDGDDAALAVVELDACSGALSVPGAATRLLVPLLDERCRLRRLSACHLSRAAVRALAAAVQRNSSLHTLALSSNLICSSAVGHLVASLGGHASLTTLHLAHNPFLDAGGTALAAALPSTRVSDLSLAFTGVADRTCEALALVLAGDAPALRRLNLSGNCISTAGCASLAARLGPLAELDLAANTRMDAAAAVAIATALGGSALRSLRLAGCKVDRKGCSRLAAALLTSSHLAHLDLSSNHFGSAGSDKLAWALGDCAALRSLSLADCAIEDDGADELLEALVGGAASGDDGDDGDGDGGAAPARLQRLDLRWNKLSAKHQGGRGVSADVRANASGQKQHTAADRQTAHLEQTWREAKSKKVQRVPKWVREQQKQQQQQQQQQQQGGGAGGAGSAMS